MVGQHKSEWWVNMLRNLQHTFATTVTLSNGVPIETVSKMLGHTNLKTTQHYAKILDKKISEDMKNLRAKYSDIK